MNAIVFEHVPVSELPLQWRAKLRDAAITTVTVRIESEDVVISETSDVNLLFGMWRDRPDMADVDAYVRHMRADRFNDTGTADG